MSLQIRHETERTGADSDERHRAHQRVQARRDFVSHGVGYVVVNAFLVGVWALTGAGYFWPGWVLLGWGVLLSLDAWKVFYQRPVTDADVEAEMQRHTPSP